MNEQLFGTCLSFGQGFYKLGGYKIFPVCLSCEHIDVRSQACQLLAEISQNNPFCQSRALDSGFIHLVLNILKGEESTKVLRSALYAASCKLFSRCYLIIIGVVTERS